MTTHLPLFLVLCPTLAAAVPESFPEANGLVRTLVAREPLVKNPISVSVDVDGTIYVTETTRRKAADLDIREFRQWIPNDLSHTTVEDKLAFFRKAITPEAIKDHPSLKDHNKDGKIDSRDLTAFTEKIIRLTDNDGDGVMDGSGVFAADFNTEVTGIAAGVFAWRGDVFTTIAPDVWKLRDSTGDGKADQRESIVHGFGVHIAYAGHDMHGLIRGPDGRLYWSIGDKGTNVVSKEGKRWAAPHEGAVLRCYPDGSGFEIFARGLRNPQEIAFDDYGNLFSVDNDADFKGERERFVYITEGSDTGWRCYYQYRGSAYNPWLSEEIWKPAGNNQPAYITPALSNYSDGPAGFAYNPGTALNDRYRGSFFMTEFPKGNLRAFKVEPDGASFKMVDDHLVMAGPMAIGCSFGPAGELFLADWSGGYPLNEEGAVWKLDDPSQARTAIRKEVAVMLESGPAVTSTTDLLARLGHADQRIRLDAQWELANRNAIHELEAVASDSSSSQLAVIHALSGLAQTRTFIPEVLKTLSKNSDAEIRAQAAKYAGETAESPVAALIPMLADPSLRVRFHTATAIGKLRMTQALDGIIAMLEENADHDAFVRHAGVLALAGMDIEQVASKTIGHPSPSVRLAAAVAFRRTDSSLVTHLLGDGDAQVVDEAAHAIYDEPMITAAIPALAEVLETRPDARESALRRSIAANRRVADAAAASRLTKFAADEKSPTPLRIAALEALASWTSRIDLDLVDGRWDPVPAADGSLAGPIFAKVSPVLQNSENAEIARQAAAVAKALGISAVPSDLAQEASDRNADAAGRVRALESLVAADPMLFDKAALPLLEDAAAPVRIAAASLLAGRLPAEVSKYALTAITKSTDIGERQRAVTLLPSLPDSAPILVRLLESSTETSQNRAIWLELNEAAESMKSDPSVAKAAANFKAKLASAAELGSHLAALEGGNAQSGSRVLNENLAAQCVACHRVGDEGSNVGPPLTQIGNRERMHILESIVLPQAELTPGFGLMTVKLKNGSIHAGTLQEESDQTLKLRLPDGNDLSLPIAEIATRTDPVSTMPPMGAVLKPRELRDLVEYLSTLK